MSHKRRMKSRRRFLGGYMAIGLAVAVGSASFAQAPRGLGDGKPAGTGIDVKERQAHQMRGGLSLAVPIGSVSVGPEVLGGEPIYERRMTVGQGMTIVEVSTTPFMPVLASNEGLRGVGEPEVRPDQPASW